MELLTIGIEVYLLLTCLFSFFTSTLISCLLICVFSEILNLYVFYLEPFALCYYLLDCLVITLKNLIYCLTNSNLFSLIYFSLGHWTNDWHSHNFYSFFEYTYFSHFVKKKISRNDQNFYSSHYYWAQMHFYALSTTLFRF